MSLSENELAGASAQRIRYVAARAAYDRVGATERYVSKIDPAIADLLSKWEEYERERQQNEQHLGQLEQEVARAQEVAEQSRQRLEQAELEAKPVLLTSAEEARLEHLYELDSGGKGWRRKGLAPEEHAERQALLDKVGVNSWTEYSVFRMSPTASPEKQNSPAEA